MGAGQTQLLTQHMIGADAYNAISSGCRTSMKVFGLLLPCYRENEAPGIFKAYHYVRMPLDEMILIRVNQQVNIM